MGTSVPTRLHARQSLSAAATRPLTGPVWERRCLVSAAPVRAPCVRYPTTTIPIISAIHRAFTRFFYCVFLRFGCWWVGL